MKPIAATTDDKLINVLNEIYFNGSVRHARAKHWENGDITYEPIDGNPTEEDWEKHFAGEIFIGSYTLLPDSTVRWCCWDVDSVDPVKAYNLTEDLVKALGEIPCVIEPSGGKGYHIWIFFIEPETASKVKEMGIAFKEKLGFPSTGETHVEFFPKQGKLISGNRMGNLVRVPFGLHPKTRNRSVILNVNEKTSNGAWIPFGNGNVLTAMQKRTSLEFIKLQLEKLDESGTDIFQKVKEILSPYWTPGGRHELCLMLSGYLATLGWVSNDCLRLVEELTDEQGGDKVNLIECVISTFNKFSEGQAVKGFSGLVELLPVGVMRLFSDLVNRKISNPAIQLIDRIRLKKGDKQKKIREVCHHVYTDLKGNGLFVQAKGTTAYYWFENVSHKLWDLSSEQWLTLLYKRYGILREDSFYNQVYASLQHNWKDEARRLEVHHRSHWDGKLLWINLGDERVYRLDGREIVMTYNGENNLLFLTEENGPCCLVDDLTTVKAVNPWDYLTAFNFERKTGVNGADPEEQRHLLRAYILSMAFTELAETKPIGGILGPRGSGKTSASRNLYRFWTYPYGDVLSLQEDKQDAFRSSIENTVMIVLDNLERSSSKWITTYLNQISTGAQITLRELYKTNAKRTFTPYCYTLFSAVELPEIMKDDAFSSRCLPFQLEQLESPRGESYLQREFYTNYAKIWAGYLEYLNEVVSSLHRTENEESGKESIRLADFGNFCRRIRYVRNDIVNHTLTMAGIANLTRQQDKLSPTSAFIQSLELWLAQPIPREDPSGVYTIAELYSILQRVAVENRLAWQWKTPQALSIHVRYMTELLRTEYNCTFGEASIGKGNVRVTYSFRSMEYHNG